MDFCIFDDLHLLKLVAVLNILLYVGHCLKFDSAIVKTIFALDFGLALKITLETAVGPAIWPQDAYRNFWIVFCFSAFFYILAPNVWGSLFLIVGVLSIEGAWEPIEGQIRSFLQHSLDIMVEDSKSNAIFAGVILFIFVCIFVKCMFHVYPLRLVVMSFVCAIKAMSAAKLLYIEVIKNEPVCCSASSPLDQCPFWFNQPLWACVCVLTVARGLMTHYELGACKRRPPGKLTALRPAFVDKELLTPIAEEPQIPAQTKAVIKPRRKNTVSFPWADSNHEYQLLQDPTTTQ